MKLTSILYVIIVMLIISIVTLLLYNIPDDNTDTSLCVSDELVKTHYHYTITVFSNNSRVIIPDDIGIVGKCMNDIHTHDKDGLVHIESEKVNFTTSTIVDFINLWVEKIGQDEFYKIVSDNGTMVLNGEYVLKDFYGYIPEDGDNIVIWY